MSHIDRNVTSSLLHEQLRTILAERCATHHRYRAVHTRNAGPYVTDSQQRSHQLITQVMQTSNLRFDSKVTS